MIDNIDIIRPLLKFENENEFYFVQILQRSKENPELGKNNRLVKAYYIYSEKYLIDRYEEMKTLAASLNARIYIHLNRRNSVKLSFEMMEDLAHSIKSNQFNSLDKLYNSVCGRHHSEKDKSWVVDVDEDFDELGYEMLKILEEIEPIGDKLIAKIPTKNGFHLITKPFNSQRFSQIYPKIELHKNNPTILFIP